MSNKEKNKQEVIVNQNLPLSITNPMISTASVKRLKYLEENNIQGLKSLKPSIHNFTTLANRFAMYKIATQKVKNKE